MNFTQELPIYLQIENFMKDKILLGIWKQEERIPSVRDLASILEVNPNTVMKSYESLQAASIIYMQRGIGYFVDANAVHKLIEEKKAKFFADLPTFFQSIDLLGISWSIIEHERNKFISSSIK